MIVPKSQDLARSYIRSSDINFVDNFLKTQKFNDKIKGVTKYADKKDINGNLENLYIKEINNRQFQITFAKKGKFEEINNKPVLKIFDGQTINLNGENELTNISFSKSDFYLVTLNQIQTIKIPRNFFI